LFGRRVLGLTSWAEIDLLPPPTRVLLPGPIAALSGPVEDAAALVTPEAWDHLERSLAAIPVPDVAALARQAREWQGPAAERRREELRLAIVQGESSLLAMDERIQAFPCADCHLRKECERMRRNERRIHREIVELEEE